MTELSFGERIKTIFEVVTSSTFFISLLVILVLTITILIVNKRVQSKVPKYFALLAYLVITVFTLFKYGRYVLSINDSVVDKFFSAMYFPNLVVYLAMLLITLLLLTLTFINKNFSFVTKICNAFCFSLIWFFFVLILDVVKSEGINVYETAEVYSSATMMILLQASMYVFFIWMGILLMNLAVRKISDKLDNKGAQLVTVQSVNIPQNEEPDEEIKEYTDEEFEFGYLNQRRMAKNEEFVEIARHKDIEL